MATILLRFATLAVESSPRWPFGAAFAAQAEDVFYREMMWLMHNHLSAAREAKVSEQQDRRISCGV
jgi:hypothetical protein